MEHRRQAASWDTDRARDPFTIFSINYRAGIISGGIVGASNNAVTRPVRRVIYSITEIRDWPSRDLYLDLIYDSTVREPRDRRTRADLEFCIHQTGYTMREHVCTEAVVHLSRTCENH